MNQNKLLAKSDTMNLCGIIGCALAILGMVIPSIRASYMGMGMSFTLFTSFSDGGTSLWVLIPLLFTAGACALYVLKMNTAGFCATIVSMVAFIVICVIKCAVAMGDMAGSGAGLHYTIGWYVAMLGFVVAIAAPWINDFFFKNVGKAASQQPFNPNMQQPQQYMNQGQQQYGQNVQQANPYMNQQMQQNVQQANPYMNQAPQNMQQQAQQYANQGMQQANPYLNQGQQAMDQAQQFVNNNVPNDQQ